MELVNNYLLYYYADGSEKKYKTKLLERCLNINV